MSKISLQTQSYPLTEKVLFQHKTHEDIRDDYYHWLKEKSNPKVIQHLEKENEFTESILAPLKPLQQTIHDEIKNRIPDSEDSYPVKYKRFQYYSKTLPGKEYRVYYRSSLETPHKEEILLDLNKISEELKSEYVRLGNFSLSPDEKILAYSLDTNGSEYYTLYFKTLEGEENFSETLYPVSTIAWGMDNKTLVYSIQDEIFRPYQIHLHILGTPQSEDKFLYEEKDERFLVGVYKSLNNQYIVVQTDGTESSEIRLLNAHNPLQSELKLFSAREENHLYSIYPHKNSFFVLTNKNAENYQILKYSDKDLSSSEVILPHDSDVYLESLDVFENYLFCTYRKQGLMGIKILDLHTEKWQEITLPESICAVMVRDNPHFATEKVRFYYESLTTPETIYDYSPQSENMEFLYQKKLGETYHSDDYLSQRVMVRSTDGEDIPMDILCRKEDADKKNLPCLLYGYGSYGICIDPEFSINRLSLLNRGFVYAIAHIRGSSTLGKKWYQNGKILQKKNTFTDFINCAEYLIQKGKTSPEKLFIEGRSAGGLLIGATVNLRPELFAGAVANVPFVDCLNTMLDSSLPLTIGEYDEWGNPNEKPYYDYMKSYCPYTNIRKQNYPSLLFIGGLNDPRVSYWEPAKYIAKVREYSNGNSPALLYTQMGFGHGGAAGRFARIQETAMIYSFYINLAGIEK